MSCVESNLLAKTVRVSSQIPTGERNGWTKILCSFACPQTPVKVERWEIHLSLYVKREISTGTVS